ncbi:MAG: UvrD-helicase domain-containing protein, partial [Bacilli bacterium]|nr:UvrD-helicase domain-containing protein [Bacilli bacterium]
MPKWTEEQSLAINSKGKNIIVSAGAGSGKTAVLSERVLTHIKNGIDISDMLILTFTNAAAAEMKERIRKKVMAYDELKDQADKIDVADITTFDAYALSLVKKYNHLLNISDKVNIADSSLIMLKKREFLFVIFDEYYSKEDERFLKLINDFCLKDDKEIFESVLKINDSLDNLYNKEKYLQNYVGKYYTDENIGKFILEYFSLIESKIKEIKVRINYLSSYVDFDYIEKVNECLDLLFLATNYDDVKRSLDFRLPNLPRGSVDEAKKIKSDIASIIKELKELTRYGSEEVIKKSILSTKDYASALVDIVLKLSSMVMNFKKENNFYEFIDISKMAIKILEDNESIREELKNKYKEILIDEYQDTNDLQEKFVSLICDNNVYMVGDIKQSIYRFRNANPLLFKNKYDSYGNGMSGMKIDLNKNFRSRDDVCDAINLIFNLVMDSEIGGADYLSSHQMVYGNKAYENIKDENYKMEILNYNSESEFSKEEIEIFTIARDIQAKIKSGYKIMDKETLKERKVNYSDFVILMDRSSSFENYKKVFEYLNIPLSIYRDKDISDSVDIMLIRNLYRIIISIYDKN